MKAEHRHDLKTNELAAWLGNLPAWANQNLKTIIYVTVVVVLVLASFFYYRYQKTVVASREQVNLTALLSQLPQHKAFIAQKQTKGEDNAFTLLNLTDGLDSIAKTASSDAVAAMALIKNAEIMRTELQFRFGSVSQQDLATQIGKAKESYTKALDIYLKRSPNPSLEALAKIGLGLCEEELGNPDGARKLYQEVATGAAYEGTTPAAAAKQRLVAMNSFTEKLVLKPMPRTKIQMQVPVVREPNAPAQN
jgi:tetratricopeptide (TPR) repeat protein